MTVWVKITHPDVTTIGTVALSSLPVHEANGWVLMSDEADTGTVDATIELDDEENTDGEN